MPEIDAFCLYLGRTVLIDDVQKRNGYKASVAVSFHYVDIDGSIGHGASYYGHPAAFQKIDFRKLLIAAVGEKSAS